MMGSVLHIVFTLSFYCGIVVEASLSARITQSYSHICTSKAFIMKFSFLLRKTPIYYSLSVNEKRHL